MKRILKALLISLLIPGIALAEFPGLTNSSQATLYGSQQQSGPLSIDLKGNLYVRAIDPTSGLTQSVIPLSNAASPGFNGPGTALVAYTNITTDTVEANSTTSVLNLTAHVARVGDFIKVRSGTLNAGLAIPICSTATNSVTMCYPFPEAVSTGANDIAILRPLIIGASGTTDGSSIYGAGIHTYIDGKYFNGQTAANYSTNILKLEDTAHSSGDAGVQMLGVQNSGWFTLNADGDYSPIATGRAGQVYSTIVLDDTLGVSHTPVRAEDAAFSNGDPVVMTGAVNNRSVTAYNTTNGDVTPIGVNDYGGVFCDLDPRYSGNTIAPNQREDTAFTDQNGVMIAGGQSLSAIAQTVGTSGDVAPPSMDLGNRFVTTAAPSGEMIVGCNTAVTTATTGTVIAAVASKFTFITSLSCTNTGGTASRVILEDGDGTDLANVFLAATSGFAAVSFPTPVRTNVVNKAIQVNVITSGSSTICCASGYTGVI